jgi:transposase
MKPVGQGEEAMLRRHELTEEQWNAIKDLLPGKEGDPGVTAKDNRLFMNAIFFVAKTGIPWRDLPERFGHWHNVFQRFNRSSPSAFGRAEELDSGAGAAGTLARWRQHEDSCGRRWPGQADQDLFESRTRS